MYRAMIHLGSNTVMYRAMLLLGSNTVMYSAMLHSREQL